MSLDHFPLQSDALPHTWPNVYAWSAPYPPNYRQSAFAYLASPPRSSPAQQPPLSPPPSYSRPTHPFPPPAWPDSIYTLDSPPPAPSPSPSARASSIASSLSAPHVKLEHDDPPGSDCFVMEFSPTSPAAQACSSLAPPTQVPLRATQASKAMRKMMGVFRLNPFAIHESAGQPTTTWSGEDPGPLEEEPQMFEFQLDLPGCESTTPATESARIRSHSPDQLHTADVHDAAASWQETSHTSSHYSSLAHPSWLQDEAPPSYPLPSLRQYSPHLVQSPSPPRRTPLDAVDSDSIDDIPSISSMARRWSNQTNIQAPFML
ncbi:hypothetical protein F5I97DRAFT_1090529 [Phlebopus sp. FC_14]|nr:hypothetical protein F5I97DRAFT_1090529 [Phlebopus sp. FC_14]